MKKNIKYILIGLVALGFTSCNLDLMPETTLTDASYWKTEKDLQGACNKLYALLAGYEDETGVKATDDLGGYNHDTRADELVKTSADGISAGSRTVPSTANNWKLPYRRIFTANNILEKGEQVTATDDVKARYYAEARFFRAYYYFELVKKYGDVPLILKAINDTKDPELNTPRTPREEVIQQCYTDLEYAAKWLPTKKTLDAAKWGHVTRSAALALTARIGLYEGTRGKYHNLNNNYKNHLQKSIAAAEAVMKEGHSLYPNFQKLFTFDAEGSTNNENIFVKVYGPNGAGTVTHGNSRQMENSVSVTRQMVDMFLYTDGLPREKSPLKIATETSFDDVFKNRDPRLNMTVYKLGEEAYKGAYVPFANQHGNGYSLKKGFILSEWSTNSKETLDKMIIRYAEVLITYAEALYENNGSITDAELDKTVNALRERAGFKTAAGVVVKLTNAFVTANGLNMLDEIRRERTIEFIDENMRYDDIMRWKIAEKVLPTNMVGAKFVDSETNKARTDIANRLTDKDGKLNGVQVYDQADMYVIEIAGDRRFDATRDYLYPVPLNEISLTSGAVTQNPNW